MANPEHLEILKQGVEVWNKWREKNPKIHPDLGDIDLSEEFTLRMFGYLGELLGEYFKGGNYHECDIDKTQFSGINLSGTNLQKTDLSGANLTLANLQGAFLQSANLFRSDLSYADLWSTNLSFADLKEAKICHADLKHANLMSASLNWADLTGADLFGAKIDHADLDKADFTGCILGFNKFSDVDLSNVKGLETCIHTLASSIGIDTIYKSKGNIPEKFLRDAGVPDSFIKDVLPYIKDFSPIQYYSCFISYSGIDTKFAERLFADLQTKGLRVWFFPEDAVIGRTILREVDEAIKVYDKLIVICSRNSLRSAAVIDEMERALEKEAKHLRDTGRIKDVLTPISIDNYLSKEWEHPIKVKVLRKVVGDFRGCKSNMDKYSKALDKLMIALASEERDATDADTR